MKKKLVSLLVAGSLVASMAAIATTSVSAIIDEKGCYTPGDNVEATNRYYFAMPKSWYSTTPGAVADSAGVYWWDGTDAGSAVDGTGGSSKWPGYKAQKDETMEDLYYVDCPTDVPTIVWNNYLDGGTDKEAPIYTIATQAIDQAVEFCSDGDSDLYSEDFFAYMEEAYYDGNDEVFGDFKSNFYYDEEFECFAFEYDNMVYVIDPNRTSANFEGKLTYFGDFYFYYGDGTYGNYPTKADAQSKPDGVYGDLTVEATPDEVPTTPSKPAGGDSTKPTVPAPGQDATSATGVSSTTDSVDNGTVQTGEATYAIVLLTILASVCGVVVFTRKKIEG